MADLPSMNSIISTISDKGGDLRDKYLKNPRTLAEKLLRKQAITCSITMPVKRHTKDSTECITTTIPFYMTNDFTFSLTNNFGEMLDQEGMIGDFAQLINGVNAFRGKTQVSLQSEAMSTKVWKGSKFDGFTVECFFVATNRSFNTIDIIRMLSAACLPGKLMKGDKSTGTEVVDGIKTAATGLVDLGESIGRTISNLAGKTAWAKGVTDTSNQLKGLIHDVGMTAPLQYGLRIDSSGNAGDDDYKINKIAPLPNTTLTLQIGDYFVADQLIVNSISNVTFSKELIAPKTDVGQGEKDIYNPWVISNDYGFPLYAKCTINLSPCAMMTYDKFYGYFRKPGGSAWGDVFDTAKEIFDL